MLLVWERGSWSTPGGAVEPGENKLDALERELREEVNLTLDLVGWGAQYLGGWQQSKARDNLVNDNFSSFLVKVPAHAQAPTACWFLTLHTSLFYPTSRTRLLLGSACYFPGRGRLLPSRRVGDYPRRLV